MGADKGNRRYVTVWTFSCLFIYIRGNKNQALNKDSESQFTRVEYMCSKIKSEKIYSPNTFFMHHILS